jgi:hypothetical protein
MTERPAADEALDVLEVELRQVPGVRVVTFDVREDLLVVQLGVEPGTDDVELRSRASQAAGSMVDRPLVIEVLGALPAAESARRVRLLAVLVLPGDEVEVHLTLGDQRTIGRRQHADEATAAAEATLDALQALGLPVPFRVRWSSALGTVREDAVAVSLVSEDDTAGRHGVAAAATRAEAAARATLHALNRYLSNTELTQSA